MYVRWIALDALNLWKIEIFMFCCPELSTKLANNSTTQYHNNNSKDDNSSRFQNWIMHQAEQIANFIYIHVLSVCIDCINLISRENWAFLPPSKFLHSFSTSDVVRLRSFSLIFPSHVSSQMIFCIEFMNV